MKNVPPNHKKLDRTSANSRLSDSFSKAGLSSCNITLVINANMITFIK